MSETNYPLTLHRFQVDFEATPPSEKASAANGGLCQGSFAECTGFEATMEPKVIKAGGMNYGAAQRAGPVSFGTVILKRGMTNNRDLWKAFAWLGEGGHFATRFNVTIHVLKLDGDPDHADQDPAFTIRLSRALPVKFKCGDLNARATDIAVEELHLAHEGLSIT
jgi:phage tail-like protein